MSAINNFDLGKMIFDLRTKKKMSQNELAEKAETTRTTISKWETGNSEPSASQLMKIADAFGVSIDYLCGNANSVGEKICVLDTCVALERPKIIDLLVKYKGDLYTKIVIPDVVIQELNNQKDHGKGSNKQRAWLAMVTIEKYKNELTIDKSSYNNKEINDDRIMNIAIYYAKASINNKVDIITNDVYFSLKHASNSFNNLSVKSSRDIELVLHKDDEFDELKTQEFISKIKTGNLNEVKAAYNSEVNVNRIDSQSGRTPLILAIRDKKYEIVKYLLSLNEIDIERRDDEKYNFTPLLHCCQLKDANAMRILIENGANVNSSSRGKNKGNTPLMVCSWGGFIEGIKILMENESLSFNQQDNNGFTALHKACYKDRYEAIKILIDKVDKDIEDFENKKAVEHLDKKSNNFDRISELFNN